MSLQRHPQSPRLDHSPESLPREAYLSDAWFKQEMTAIFLREWICVGRANDFADGHMQRVTLGTSSVIVCKSQGVISAFHNVCRHRGAELCKGEIEKLGKLITCPYHAWAYAANDGRLISTAFAKPTADFKHEEHSLIPIATRTWNGFLFLNAATTPGKIHADVPLTTLDNWPMDDLVTGHRWSTVLNCNWKIFWENYSECLHCPGIHPELCDMVPIYATGIMGASEALGWTPDEKTERNLKTGAETWTLTGKPCGPVFEKLTEAERNAGYNFVTIWPSLYVVAHVDYVRSVRIEPLAPEKMRLTAEWHFPPATLRQSGFDAAGVSAFAKIVMAQDGEAAEMNQRGLRSPAFSRGRLMPEEYEIHRFHTWLRQRMEDR